MHLPFYYPLRLTATVWRPVNRYPGTIRSSGWWKTSVLWYGGEVVLSSTTRTLLLINSTLIAGIISGLLAALT